MSNATLDGKGILETCPHCGQRNRVPFARLPDTGACGQCHAALPPVAAARNGSKSEKACQACFCGEQVQ